MKLFLSLALTLAVGFGAGYATATSIGTWYAALNKPSFNPPNAVFMPVWTVLYILMGISFYLVWKQPASAKRNTALAVFTAQLILNGAWSIIFFNLHVIGFAMTDIVLLWLLIIITILLFSRISKAAAWLLAPYLLWVSFAAVLNYAIWQLNT